jgi:hypothetical protein
MIAYGTATAMNHFQTHGWVRIRGAFTADEAAAMRDVIWRALAAEGIQRDDPATWKTERPAHLQHLKSNPHAPPTAHLGTAPRFLLNKDIYL